MKGRNILMGIVLLTSIMVTTVVYSAFSSRLQIGGEAVVRAKKDIRITNISIINQTNGAYETYNNRYNIDTTSMYVTLPANSSITYQITITNTNTSPYFVSSIVHTSHTNGNVSITKTINTDDLVASNSTKNFTITLTNNTSSQQIETLVTQYTFEKALIITFNKNGGSGGTSSTYVKANSSLPNISVPTRSGYTFVGYSNNINTSSLKCTNNFIGTSTRRIDFMDSSNGWALTNAGDKGKHLNSLITLSSSYGNLEFNDVVLSSNMYKTTIKNGIYYVYFDFDITSEMVTYRSKYDYATQYRFFDIEGISSTNTIIVQHAVLGGKMYYNNAGSGITEYDSTDNKTLYAVWKQNT